ncbi:Uncharacterised protein [Arcanobacterium haemolyticum]|uniref:hypothetical protein n=1 Tax=Arcanobacterium haemolyticum TaxID=28264 RepID=UPI000D8684A8|nr:hypothetical protein [Arcanobacterium haemolyticum]SPT76057.1 Uncharacterised protein [Arcanobacterium haemolyticum]
MKQGDSYTFSEKEGLPEGLKVKVTIADIVAMHEDGVYPLGDKKGQKINDGLIARRVTWNDFFRPLDVSQKLSGSITGRDKERLNWFDKKVLYPSNENSRLQLGQHLDPSGFGWQSDNIGNQGYRFKLKVEGIYGGRKFLSILSLPMVNQLAFVLKNIIILMGLIMVKVVCRRI